MHASDRKKCSFILLRTYQKLSRDTCDETEFEYNLKFFCVGRTAGVVSVQIRRCLRNVREDTRKSREIFVSTRMFKGCTRRSKDDKGDIGKYGDFQRMYGQIRGCPGRLK